MKERLAMQIAGWLSEPCKTVSGRIVGVFEAELARKKRKGYLMGNGGRDREGSVDGKSFGLELLQRSLAYWVTRLRSLST